MYSLVSIIIPVYNDAKKFLTETLASVSAQTRTNWECICVDDGCTDASQEMIAEQIRKDGRFRMVCQPNKGICGGRNRGLDVMRGDAFMHMDSDDLLLPNSLEILEDAADQSGAPMVGGQRLPFKTLPENVPFVPGGHLMEGSELRQRIFGAPYGLPFPSWAKLCNRRALGHLRFLPLRYGDDTYYTPLTRSLTTRCYVCNATVYLWREGHTSASNIRDCSPTWLKDYSGAVHASAQLFTARWEREGIFAGVKWVAHRLYRGPSFRHTDQWTPEFREAVQICCRNLLESMPPFPTHLIWRLRLWLTLHGHLKLAKPILPRK